MALGADPQLLVETKKVVNAAVQACQADCARRRTAMAAAGRRASLAAAPVADSNGEGGFDVYGRGARQGAESKRLEGRSRRRAEKGAVHLSRHCEYEPTFDEIGGLAIAVQPAPLANPGRGQARGSALSTASTFRARRTPALARQASAEPSNRWVLDEGPSAQGSTHSAATLAAIRAAAAADPTGASGGIGRGARPAPAPIGRRPPAHSNGARAVVHEKENSGAFGDSLGFGIVSRQAPTQAKRYPGS